MLFYIIISVIIIVLFILLRITILGMGTCFDAKEKEISEILASQEEISKEFNKVKTKKNEEG